MNYTSDFADSPVQTATVAYSSLSITAATTQLYWPATSGVLPPLTRVMDLSAASDGLVLKLPPANSATLGVDAVINNKGAHNVDIQDFDGNDLGMLVAGKVVYLYVSDNTSEAGGWSSFVFGSSTSGSNAVDLAGLGLVSQANRLSIGLQTETFSTDYTIQGSDRASLLVWNGGLGTFTLPTAASLANSGFVLELSNVGTGTLTLATSGSDVIDGVNTIQLQPSEACFVICDQMNHLWYTVGRGRSRLFGYTLLTKAVTNGTVTLTQTEASSTVQRYTGTLTGNVLIVLPEVVQVYYVTNQTTGVFTLKFRTAANGAFVSVPAGQSAVLLCDGTNVVAGNAIDANVPIRMSIYDFGCVADGSTDDIVNLNAALSFAATIATATRPVDLEFNGGQCAVSGQVIPSTAVGMRNGGIKALNTGSLSSTVPVVVLQGGNFQRITSMIVDCNRVSAGVLANGCTSAVLDRLQVRNFVGYGVGNRGSTADLQLRNVIAEEWTLGSAGEMDYTQRVALGFDMQGGDYTASECEARFCAVPININQVGGGMATWIAPKARNGSSGVTKPNLPDFRIAAMGGILSVRDHQFEDGFVDVQSCPGVSFLGGIHRATSASTVATAYQITAAIAGDQGGGLSIVSNRYTGSFANFLTLVASGGNSWSTSPLWNIHGNLGGVGGTAQSTLQRMTLPNGTLASPGLSFDDTNIGLYRDTANNVHLGFSVTGVSKLALRTDNALRIGDGTTAEEVQVNASTATNSGLELLRVGNKRWTLYENNTAEGGGNAGSDFTLGAWDDTGAFIATALSVERKTGNVTVPVALISTLGTAAVTLANTQANFYRISDTVVRLQMRGTDGTLRHVDLTLAP